MCFEQSNIIIIPIITIQIHFHRFPHTILTIIKKSYVSATYTVLYTSSHHHISAPHHYDSTEIDKYNSMMMMID